MITLPPSIVNFLKQDGNHITLYKDKVVVHTGSVKEITIAHQTNLATGPSLASVPGLASGPGSNQLLNNMMNRPLYTGGHEESIALSDLSTYVPTGSKTNSVSIYSDTATSTFAPTHENTFSETSSFKGGDGSKFTNSELHTTTSSNVMTQLNTLSATSATMSSSSKMVKPKTTKL